MAAWMLPAAIGGAAILGYRGAQETNAASAQAASEQIAFQREMSNTAYQRQVEDLKAAGINPMMVTHLGGSSTPQGAMPMFVNPGAAAAGAGGAFGGALSSAAQAEKTGIESGILGKTGLAQAKANLEKTVADIGLTAQQTAKVVKDTELVAEQIATEKERPAQVRAMVANLEATTKTEAFKQLNLDQQTRLLKAQTQMYMAKAQLDENQVRAEMNTENMRRHVEQLGPVGRFISGAINVGKTLLGR
jgi:hypothetical protein